MIARTTVTTAALGACFSLAVLLSGVTGAAAGDTAKNGMVKNEMTTTGMAKVDMTKESMAKENMVKEDMAKDGIYKASKSDDVTAKNVVPDAMK